MPRQFRRPPHADVLAAAHQLAHDVAGGVPALAARLGRHPGTLYNELNAGQESHKLGLGDATAMQAVSGDHRILHAMAHTLGEVCFAVPDLTQVSDCALLTHLNRIGAAGGQFHTAFERALADRRFSASEYAEIYERGMGWIAAVAQTLARIEGLVDET